MAASSDASNDELQERKEMLISICRRTPQALTQEITSAVEQLESMGEQLGIGQASSSSTFLSGDWELLYTPGDVTRSSPFFWAFRHAFPESSDQIFGITDAIPSPIKETGPAFQTIDFEPESGTGSLVSRVKLSALGGLSSSMMTTRSKIIGVDGLDGIRLKVETTKPEDSTIFQTLGPLGKMLQESSPPFPSGEALERANPGSSEVMLRTSYCDDSLRVSRNSYGELFVW
eukprot:CAMPEP_0194204436 /NCGR_PEP_ID=MMETSP0156-20130528/3951_1 /TAXON_ID=33649 /ORGANISM="Thalassionema nitzschioides, Strain L26-B" /LENGTH=230 /DNA_ID=CAMNT_0038930445 /DNA_START=198 /DNA_END=887 /DNA_ORIENTATION=+